MQIRRLHKYLTPRECRLVFSLTNSIYCLPDTGYRIRVSGKRIRVSGKQNYCLLSDQDIVLELFNQTGLVSTRPIEVIIDKLHIG